MAEPKKSVEAIAAHFSSQLERREQVLKGSRDVIASCSRAIIAVHTGRSKESAKELANARTLLAALKRSADGAVARYIVAPEAEFVEASAVIALHNGKQIPSVEALGASPEAYLLGLLDTVGEMKRLVLDSLMHEKPDEARRYFAVMEELYSLCSPLAVYDHVANGARRKIDVARMLVEDVRGLMLEEGRRASVTGAMERLEKKLRSR